MSDSVTKQCARAWHVPVCRHRCAVVCVGCGLISKKQRILLLFLCLLLEKHLHSCCQAYDVMSRSV